MIHYPYIDKNWHSRNRLDKFAKCRGETLELLKDMVLISKKKEKNLLVKIEMHHEIQDG